MNGHVAPPPAILAICKELVHEFFKRETSLFENPSFSILSKDDILGNQSGCGSHSYTFLSCRHLSIVRFTDLTTVLSQTDPPHHIETQPTLSLSIKHYEIHNADYSPDTPRSVLLFPHESSTHIPSIGARTSHHVSVPRQDLLITNIYRRPGCIYNNSVGVHHPIGGNCRVGRGTREGELGGELAVYGARKMNA